MDYSDLSVEFLQTMYKFYRMRPQKHLHNAMHGEAFVLQFIAQSAAAVIPGDIESVMNISSARVTAVLNGLENKGLISRSIDPSDRRRTILTLTPEGEAKVNQGADQLLSLTSDMLEFLGPEDAQHFLRIMKKLADSWRFDGFFC